MNRHAWLIAAALIPVASSADPLVTITCDAPSGVTQEYGVHWAEQVEARVNKTPVPSPTYKGPVKDEYLEKPTFIVDSSKKKLTVVRAEAAFLTKLREESKKLDLPSRALSPAEELDVVSYSPAAIIAIELNSLAGSAVVYSFYPKLGVLFMSSQYLQLGDANAVQQAFFAKCEFSWNHPG